MICRSRRSNNEWGGAKREKAFRRLENFKLKSFLWGTVFLRRKMRKGDLVCGAVGEFRGLAAVLQEEGRKRRRI